MREIRSSGSVEGVVSDHDSYSDCARSGRMPLVVIHTDYRRKADDLSSQRLPETAPSQHTLFYSHNKAVRRSLFTLKDSARLTHGSLQPFPGRDTGPIRFEHQCQR